MTDDVETEEQGEAPAASGGRKKLFMIIGAAVVVLLIGGGAGYYFLVMAPAQKETAMLAEVKSSYYYELPTMTVNLNSDKAEFLKLSVSLQLEDEKMAEAVEPNIARVVDAFQVYLRELRRSDLEGSAGIYRLKEELRRRVNLAIYPARIEDILFKEILVQ